MGGMTSSSATPDVDGSEILDHGVRIGLVAYGLVHLVVAWTAIQLALGESQGKANQTGALQQLAQDSMGGASLYAVALGFAALVLWQAMETVTGHRKDDGAKRLAKRGASAVKTVVYAVLAITSVKVASGNGGRSQGTDTITAQVMSAPGGQLLVGGVGLAVIGAGGVLAFLGVTRKFTKRIDAHGSSGARRTPVVVLGTVGHVAKGVALGAIGALFVVAAVQHDADESGGLDQALRALLQQPYGRPLLIAVALGLAAYGAYCFLWARHLDRD